MAIFTPELLEKLKIGYYFWPFFFVAVIIYLTIFHFINLKSVTNALKWIPGPSRTPLLGNLLNFAGHSWSDIWTTSNEWLDKYDGLLQMWIFHNPTILVAKKEIVEAVLKGKADTLMRKSSQYKFMKSFFGDGLLSSNSVEWNERRKLLNPCFDEGTVNGYIPSICHHAKALVSHLREKAEKNEIIDFQKYSQLSTLDINTDTLMNSSPNFLESQDMSYINAFKRVTETLMRRTFTPLYNWSIIYTFTLSKLFELKAAKTIGDFAEKIIEKRKKSRPTDKKVSNDENQKCSSNFLDCLLDHHEQNRLTRKDVQNEVKTFLFAGNETVASGIAFTLYLIGRHPEIQDQLVQEIKTVIPELSSEEEQPSASQLDKLELLGRCIKESLRLYPPVPWIGRELKNVVKIDDSCLLPEGINIAISIYKLHRSQKYYENPDEFDPDRFLNGKYDDNDDNFTYMPFGAGWRKCIGRKMALLEMKIIISHILKEYSVTSTERPEELDVTANVILRSNNGLRVRLNSRNK